jgi:hypothetical protein
MCNFPGMILRDSICFPNVAGAGVAKLLSVCGLTNAGTFNSVVQYFQSLSRK